MDSNRRYAIFSIICLVLAFPAFLLHLGLMPLLADEPTRAVVALEMIISKNYVVPTILGEFYYNKPTFYNWILVVLFKLTGNVSEWMVRLPSVVPLFLFAWTIFFFVKRHLDKKVAVLSALFFLTFGRMITYASLLGHIDIFYSWITFLSFIAIYECFRREQYGWLFVLSYVLTAIGFLCKGLPSIVFQGLTLAAFFVVEKKWRQLFSLRHLAGITVFLLIVGGYFYAYHQYNPITQYFETLWTESSKRTVLEKSWLQSIAHLFIFPFETLYQALPWSLLVIFLFRKGFPRTLWNNDFLRFGLVVFCANIVVYWLSPSTHPRYIFMLYPFLFIAIAYGYLQFRESSKRKNVLINWLFGFFALILCLGQLLPSFLAQTQFIHHVIVKSIILFVLTGLAFVAFIKFPRERMLSLVIILLLGRIGFDLFVLPVRHKVSPESEYKQMATKVGELTKGEGLKIYEWTPINHDMIFYITRERGQILKRVWELDPEQFDDYYIVQSPGVDTQAYDLYYTFETKYKQTSLYLVKYKPEYFK